jgi:hypothetical protein
MFSYEILQAYKTQQNRTYQQYLTDQLLDNFFRALCIFSKPKTLQAEGAAEW